VRVQGEGGAVYVWGQGQHGRLGLGDDQPRWTPTVSSLPADAADAAVQERETTPPVPLRRGLWAARGADCVDGGSVLCGEGGGV
jgi:hypothetical protein